MKILILGSSGILGKKLYDIFKGKATIHHNGIVKRKYELNYHNLKKIILKSKPEYVFNCVAITDIDFCEKNKILCKKINTNIIKYIFEIKKKYKLDFKLIHFSTDQMYDGNKLKFSSENSKIFINNYYTKTKIMSEKICLKNYALVFRINFFGYTKKGVTFSNWVVKNFKSKKKFFLVDDVYFNPLGLTTIGQIILKIVNKNLFSPGIYNLGTNDQISKKDFAINFAKISNIFKYNFDIKKINELVKTKRSKNMSMNTKKFETKFNIKLPKILNEIKKEIRYTKL